MKENFLHFFFILFIYCFLYFFFYNFYVYYLRGSTSCLSISDKEKISKGSSYCLSVVDQLLKIQLLYIYDKCANLLSNVCVRHHSYNSLPGIYTCQCNQDHTGPNCIDINECTMN